MAYKPDIDDTRESPALKLIELLRAEGCRGQLPRPARAASCASLGLESVPLDAGDRDAPTASSSSPTTPSIDYADARGERAQLVVDFRNATGSLGSADGKVVKL